MVEDVDYLRGDGLCDRGEKMKVESEFSSKMGEECVTGVLHL